MMSTTYYPTNVKNKDKTKSLRSFHNFVKMLLLKQYVTPGKTKILDLSAGRGADLFKHKFVKVDYTLHVNANKNALDVAKKAYQNELKDDSFKVDFLQLDLTKDSTKNIAEVMKKIKFDLVTIFFAFHYFLENQKTLDTIFKNIDTFLKPGGTFIMTGLDGQRVFDLLNDIGEEESLDLQNKNGTSIVRIKKNYSDKELLPFGQKISFYFPTIGSHDEYLINFEYIVKYFEEKGYKVVDIGYFPRLLNKWKQSRKIKKQPFFLSETEFQLTVLNRYVCFIKRRHAN